MDPNQFTTPAAYAAQMSGAPGYTAGMAPYPLYGIGQVDTPAVPFYRQPLVCFGAGATLVGALWAYFGWWRPSRKNVKKNRAAKLRRELAELEEAATGE